MLSCSACGIRGPLRRPATTGSRRRNATTEGGGTAAAWTAGAASEAFERTSARARTGPRPSSTGIGVASMSGFAACRAAPLDLPGGVVGEVAVEDPRRADEGPAVLEIARDRRLDDPPGQVDVGPLEDEGLVEPLIAVDVPGEAEAWGCPAERDRRRVDLGHVEAGGAEDVDPDVGRVRCVDVTMEMRVDQNVRRQGRTRRRRRGRRAAQRNVGGRR